MLATTWEVEGCCFVMMMVFCGSVELHVNFLISDVSMGESSDRSNATCLMARVNVS